MKTLLAFLSGKKGAIASILLGIVAYLATKDILGEAEVILATLVVTVIFGGASYLTGKVVYNK